MRPSTSALSLRAAWTSMPPTTIAVREATVGPELGTIEVSCGAISTASMSTSSSPATSCGKIVLVPCPISVEAVRIRIRPSPVISRLATEPIFSSPEPVNPAPCQPSARPIPRATRAPAGLAARSAAVRARARSNSDASAARSSTSSPAASAPRTWLVAVTPPGRYTLRRRSSSGDIPSASAARLTCISAANSACGAPKPRNAPLGGVLVATARDADVDVRDVVRAARVDRRPATGRRA